VIPGKVMIVQIEVDSVEIVANLQEFYAECSRGLFFLLFVLFFSVFFGRWGRGGPGRKQKGRMMSTVVEN